MKPIDMVAIDGRRRALLVAACAGLALPPRAIAHDMPGLVQPPRDVPALTIALDDGRRQDLRSVLAGHVTALQFVLTGCSAICPLLGAIFAQTQGLLAISPPGDIQLLSISLDPLGDTPAAMRRWLQSLGAAAGWRGAVPMAGETGAMEALRGLGLGRAEQDQHTAAVMLIDRRARLVYRSEDLPDAGFLVRALTTLSRSV